MDAAVLTAWYEKMLSRAQQKGIVTKVDSLAHHVSNMTSVRDFPLFDGDFFPNRMEEVIEKGKNPPQPPSSNIRDSAKGGKPKIVKLARSETLQIADEMKRTVSSSDYSFIVATLKAASVPKQVGREKQISTQELIDDRERFLEICMPPPGAHTPHSSVCTPHTLNATLTAAVPHSLCVSVCVCCMRQACRGIGSLRI